MSQDDGHTYFKTEVHLEGKATGTAKALCKQQKSYYATKNWPSHSCV